MSISSSKSLSLSTTRNMTMTSSRTSSTTTTASSSSSTMKNFSTTLDLIKQRSLHLSEFLNNRLYFVTMSEVNLNYFLKKNDSNFSFLHFDKELLYTPFNHDFGPLNLAMLYKYCKKINSHFNRNKIIIHMTTTNRFKRVNAAFLVGSYCIIYHHLLPDDVMAKLKQLSISYSAYKTFTAFVDAGFDASEYYLHLEDCFNAIYKASITEILNMNRFNVNEYLYYEKVENGDLNWIVPGKFIAFCDPQTYSDHSTNHYGKLYVNFFRKNNITTIIRLNKSRYDAKMFTEKGFKHYNLIFIDGGVPNDYIVNEFLRIAETSTGAIAVHCKAGLGRTGTMIACYLMKHWHFTALEAIAWIRICRPGSIVGYQQKWLKLKQNFLWNHDSHDQMDNMAIKQKESNNIMAGNDYRISDDDFLNNNNDNNDIKMVECHLSNIDNIDVKNNNNNNDINHSSGNYNNYHNNHQYKRKNNCSGSINSTFKIVNDNTSIIDINNIDDNNNDIIMIDDDDDDDQDDQNVDNENIVVTCKNTLQTITKSMPQTTMNTTTTMTAVKAAATLTQGDYLNQIKLINNSRKRQLRLKINHWFNKNGIAANQRSNNSIKTNIYNDNCIQQPQQQQHQRKTINQTTTTTTTTAIMNDNGLQRSKLSKPFERENIVIDVVNNNNNNSNNNLDNNFGDNNNNDNNNYH